MTHVSSSSSWSLESAMAQPHGTGVDQVAVVAFVCQAGITICCSRMELENCA